MGPHFYRLCPIYLTSFPQLMAAYPRSSCVFIWSTSFSLFSFSYPQLASLLTWLPVHMHSRHRCDRAPWLLLIQVLSSKLIYIITASVTTRPSLLKSTASLIWSAHRWRSFFFTLLFQTNHLFCKFDQPSTWKSILITCLTTPQTKILFSWKLDFTFLFHRSDNSTFNKIVLRCSQEIHWLAPHFKDNAWHRHMLCQSIVSPTVFVDFKKTFF